MGANIGSSPALNVRGGTPFSATMTAANTFQDLDMSFYVGARALVWIRVIGNNAGIFAAKTKGEPGTFAQHRSAVGDNYGSSSFHCAANGDICFMAVMTDALGFVEIGASDNTTVWIIKILGCIKG